MIQIFTDEKYDKYDMYEKYLWYVNSIDTSPNRTLEQTCSISLDVLGQVGFRGSSHMQCILFLTFNYSLGSVRDSWLSSPLPLPGPEIRPSSSLVWCISLLTDLSDSWFSPFWSVLYMVSELYTLKKKRKKKERKKNLYSHLPLPCHIIYKNNYKLCQSLKCMFCC